MKEERGTGRVIKANCRRLGLVSGWTSQQSEDAPLCQSRSKWLPLSNDGIIWQ